MKFRFGDDEILVEEGTYPDGTKALLGVDADTGEPYAKLTTSIPGAKLGQDEYLIKTWGENVSVTEALRKSGLFRDTGRRVRSGYVEAQVWRRVASA
jgi:hypothetical protein